MTLTLSTFKATRGYLQAYGDASAVLKVGVYDETVIDNEDELVVKITDLSSEVTGGTYAATTLTGVAWDLTGDIPALVADDVTIVGLDLAGPSPLPRYYVVFCDAHDDTDRVDDLVAILEATPAAIVGDQPITWPAGIIATLEEGQGSGFVESVVAGANVTVDDTDPANPIVSATGGGLPSQTGNAGKILRTDATTAAWTDLGLVIADAPAKPSPVGGDKFVMSDSDDSDVAKRISFSDLAAALGGGVPDPTGETGKALVSNGTDAVWAQVQSDAVPQALGTADAGVGTAMARDDHVHEMPSAADVGAPSGSGTSTGTNTGDQTLPTLSSLGAVPTSRTLAGLDLSADRTASALRTALGLVIGTDVLAPNGSGASLTGIPESAVTNLVTDLAAKAPLASPTFTGTPAAPTAAAGTATTQVATTAFVGAAAPARPRVVGAYANGALSARTGIYHDATALGRLLVFPTWLWAGSIDRIYVRTGVAAVSTWRIGIYPLDASTLKPDGQTKLSGTDSSINMNATAGTLEATITATIPSSGLWGMAVLVDAYTATPSVYSVSSDASTNLGQARPWSVTGQSVSWSPQFDGIAFMATGVTTGVSALPTTCPTTAPNAQTPVVGVRYA